MCTTWGIRDQRVYLLHVLRKRMEYPELKRAVREQWQAHRATVVLIEDKVSGTQLIQELIAEGLSAITRYLPEHDKVMRLYAQTATIENGFVYLAREASWLAEYLHELTTFPNAKYDDQTDSTSQALSWIKQAPEPGIITYYRQQLACRRQPKAPIWKLSLWNSRPRLSRSSAGSNRTTLTKKALRTFAYAPVDDAESDHRNPGYTARERFVSDSSSASRNVNNRGKTRAPNERFCTSEALWSGCSLSGTEVRIPSAPPTSPRFEAFSGENQYRNASAGLGQFEDLPLPAAG